VIKIHESTGCYAVDALDLAELTDFEAHLANCCSCGHEVAEFYETTAELTLLTETTPPQALRHTLLRTVRTTPQLATSAPVNPPVVRPDAPGVEAMLLHRQWRRNRLLTGLIAAMLALLVGLGGVAYGQFKQREVQVAQVNLENDLYRAADTETAVVDIPAGGHATFVASKQLNRAMFLGSDLPDPGAGGRYTLWTATGPSLKDLTRIAVDAQVSEHGSRTKQFFSGDVAHADFLALNIEPAGSTPAVPTTPVLAAAHI
jgi:hypothetical protein